MGSGTAACIWGLADNFDHSEYMYGVAAEMGQPKTSKIGLISFLQTASAKKLIGFATKDSTFYNTLNFPFSPVIES